MSCPPRGQDMGHYNEVKEILHKKADFQCSLASSVFSINFQFALL